MTILLILLFIIAIALLFVGIYSGIDDYKNSQLQQQEMEKQKIDRKLAEKEYLEEHGMKSTTRYTYAPVYHQNWRYISFVVDDFRKNIIFFDYRGEKPRYQYKKYQNIIGCEIVTDSQVTGGVGRAVVGGVLAGGAGAIVGAMTAKKYIMSYKVVIYTKSVSYPTMEIRLITKKTATKSDEYRGAVRFAENINAVIKAIMSQR